MKENSEVERLKLSKLLLNDVNLMVVSSDKNGEITYVSPATERITGYKTNKLLGENWWNLTFSSKEESELFRNKVCNLISGKIKLDPKPYKRKFKCKDGSDKWIEWRNSLTDNNALISVGVDIHDWKLTEEIKIQSDTILGNIDSMVLVSDKEGNILFANPSVEKMLGFPVEEIMGDKWWKVTYENQDEAQRIKNAVYKYVFFLETDSTDITKRKIKTRKGDYKWIEWQLSKGINDTYISIGTDITNRISTEIELKKAKESAEEALNDKNEFLANMSHEIRTPLNAVVGFTDLLLETKLTSEQKLHLETMRSSGEILLAVINDVLDLSKLESEKFETEKISFDLPKQLNEIVRLMKVKSDLKKISLNLIVDSSTPKYVMSDPTRLGQILLNLIGNAIKFTNEGSVTVHVKQLNETATSSKVIFEIKDTGIGIVSNKINTVFGAFTQAKSDTSRIYGGTGLGLTIVKKLVGVLKGDIQVESTFGKGSVFKVTLPFIKNVGAIKSEESEQKISIDKPLNLAILLVDDNLTNQLLGKTRLERWDCEVDLANNGIEAVKKAQLKLYDVILMDIQMPIMDGYEATKIIKNDLSKEVSRIPIIAMSAYTTKEDIKRALDVGMDDYIYKPFKPKDLHKLLVKYREISKKNKSKKSGVLKEIPKEEEILPYVDLKFLREETFNERALLILLIKSFLNDIDSLLSVFKKEVKKKNWQELHKEIHKIKPSITMFGISKLEPIIYTLINKFREEKELENVKELINSCTKILKIVKAELAAELKSLSHG